MQDRTCRKLIEVALPLDKINQACRREKSIRNAHPSTLHLWWARRPLAAARAVIFAQMVDDPSAHPELFPTPEAQEAERQRLFKIIAELVQWENTNNEAVLRAARDEIWACWRRTCEANKEHPRAAELFNPDKLPAFHDPFAGGGALPLEAQRLGLEAYASDINPVAVLINKAMIEIPPRFANRPPVNPFDRQRAELEDWRGARGLAADVRYYGEWMRKEAERRIGHLYPKVEVTAEMAADRPDLKPLVGQKLTVIAWLWARTVKSPNPAFAHIAVPLASTFVLSTDQKTGPRAWVEVLPDPERGYAFTVRTRASRAAPPKDVHKGTKLGRGAGFRCVMSGVPISDKYIKAESQAGRMGVRLMAIVAEGKRGRVYLPPTAEHEAIAHQAQPAWRPEQELVGKCRDQLPLYGMHTFGDLFTPRQLVALTTFADLVGEAMAQVQRDASALSFQAGDEAMDVTIRLGTLEVAREVGRTTECANELLWQRLCDWRFGGFVFYRRYAIEGHTFDFYCHAARLAIEINNRHHHAPEDAANDVARAALLAERGIRVLRFTKHEVLTNVEGVLTTIWEALRAHPHPRSLPLGESRDEGFSPTYAQTVGVYLAFVLDRCASYWSSVCSWDNSSDKMRTAFVRQALAMVWDFAEVNPLSDLTGSWMAMLEWVWKMLAAAPACAAGFAGQLDARTQGLSADKIVSTDPPYYDNIQYADLSDFFYAWLRRMLRDVFPDLFATLATPKAEELVAAPYRHGGKLAAEQFFLNGMTQALSRLAEQVHPAFPITIYYAFKQSEGVVSSGRKISTGWETFLDAAIRAGFAITATWPIQTEMQNRQISIDANALASSIVLACRPRPVDAPIATRREFLAALKAELPKAIADLRRAGIAPVDLAQAAIGPGMAIYTRYAKVLDASGEAVGVGDALALINQTLEEILSEQEGNYDAETRWALAWFEQHGFAEGDFGDAETLSKAKNIGLEGLVDAGVLESRRGKARLLRPDELPESRKRFAGRRVTTWEALHQLSRVLNDKGEQEAAELLAMLDGRAEAVRDLCYRLYAVCERKRWAGEAFSYNALVKSWPELVRLAHEHVKYRFLQAGF